MPDERAVPIVSRSWFRSLIGIASRVEARSGYALFVDGPNVLRDPFDVDLNEVRTVAAREGTLKLARVYLDHRASSGLIQAAEAAGFDVRTTSGDVDVALSVDATSAIERDDLEGIAIATRDIDFKPVLELASQRGIKTVVIAPGSHGRSAGLMAVADEAIILGE